MSGAAAPTAVDPSLRLWTTLSPRRVEARRPRRTWLPLAAPVTLRKAHNLGSSGTELKIFGH